MTRKLAVLTAAVAIGAGAAAPAAMARHGADDPAGHDARDDHGGARVTHVERHHRHHHRGHHDDDGANHR